MELAAARDGEDFDEAAPRPTDAAFDCAHRAAGDLRRFLTGVAGRADQDDRLALIVWQ